MWVPASTEEGRGKRRFRPRFGTLFAPQALTSYGNFRGTARVLRCSNGGAEET
jgi:hypothetical protein